MVAETVGDAELIKATRAGDEHAYAELYRRHHASALRFARTLANSSADAEDIAADAFARVLATLKAGKGPDEAFRPYLLSAVRNIFYRQAQRKARDQPLDELILAHGEPFTDPALVDDESRLIATAFGELPERWRVVLWHTEVEGEKPAEVARLLGISANAVAALAYRAREGLRERYLQAHLGRAADEQCRATVAQLAAYTRNKLSRSDAQRVRLHLDECERCRQLFAELTDINSRLGAILAPLVLGAAATGALAPASAGGAGAPAAVRIVRSRAAQVGAAIAGAAAITAVILAVVATPGQAPAEAAPSGSPLAPVDTRLAPTPGPTAPDSHEPAPTTSTAPHAATTTPAESTSLPSSVPTATPTAPTTGPTAEGPVTLTATLAIGVLVRGLPGLLLLAVTNPATGTDTGTVTATLSLPAGVTLRSADAGSGWTCATSGAVVSCTTDGLRPGQTTLALIQVWTSPDAAAGVPSALLSGPDIASITVIADGGLQIMI